MKHPTVPILLVLLAAAIIVASETVPAVPTGSGDPNGLVVHEWGTFTSIADESGNAIEWLPWGGPNDLPCFVDRFKNTTKASYAANSRMETPVLYFYSGRETTVDVKVRFPHGLITEWFPRAVVMPKTFSGPELNQPGFAGIISWNGVKLRPNAAGELPNEGKPSHYYAARNVDAAMVEVGTQKEKFLFYRGLGNLSLSVKPTFEADDKVVVKSSGNDRVDKVIRFENRGGKFGYRIGQLSNGAVALAAPLLDSNFNLLRQDLIKILTDSGLYTREAEAMVATWRDSWFEEGSRLFYIVPRRAIDSILPLEINPAPVRTERTFVARVELMSPATMNTINRASAAGDRETLRQYGRFLEPIRSRALAKVAAVDRQKTIDLFQSLSSDYFAGSVSTCR